MMPLLFLGGLLYGLLRGCLFGGCLGCHVCLFSLAMISDHAATMSAVEECIDLCFVSVKEKTQ
jgi:hypothetical protein